MMANNKTVLCGGCFNTVHEGHLWFLRQAKALGKRLVVVIANDTHNKKPYARSQAIRARAIRALKIADKVLIGSKGSFLISVKKIKPNIIVLGYDQTLPNDMAKALDTMKIKIKRLKLYKSISTRSSLSAKLR